MYPPQQVFDQTCRGPAKNLELFRIAQKARCKVEDRLTDNTRVMSKMLVCVASVFAILAPDARRQTRAANTKGPWPIAAIEVTGNQRYSTAQVARISGLGVRHLVTIADLDETVARMARTGLFAEIAYRYSLDKALGGQLTIRFEVKEPEWNVPVVFDNLVWFTDPELTKAIEADVPTFDGTLPLTEGATDLVIRKLESLLKSKGLTGPVVLKTHIDRETKAISYVFSVGDVQLPICSVILTGPSERMVGLATNAINAIRGTNYSRLSVSNAARFGLTDLYYKRGYLQVAVGVPLPTLNGSCQGISVTIPVLEGVQYQWGRVEWTGVSSVSVANLDRILALASGAQADVSVLNARLRAVQDEFGRAGHIKARVTYALRLDADTRRAHLTMQVDEGPQFRMGSVEFVNLPRSDQAALARQWALKEGDVYDSTYLSTFVREHISAVSRRLGLSGFRPVATSPSGSTVVNIRFEFSRLQ